MISIDDFKNIELRIGTILEASEHPNADRLFLLKIDLGEEQRQIVAGIRDSYSAEELLGKQLVLVANLQPAKIRGTESHGMLLAGRTEDKVILLSPSEPIPNGTRLS